MRIVLWLILIVMLACQSQTVDEASIETEIRSAMTDQVSSWNGDDLDGFMKYYWASEKMTFHSGKNKLTSRDSLAAMYRRTYSGSQRGTLSFLETEIDVLSQTSAFVIGRWQVVLPDTVKAGRFTLIFRRFDEGWRIVHDHSS